VKWEDDPAAVDLVLLCRMLRVMCRAQHDSRFDRLAARLGKCGDALRWEAVMSLPEYLELIQRFELCVRVKTIEEISERRNRDEEQAEPRGPGGA